jgi:hypothetical protein
MRSENFKILNRWYSWVTFPLAEPVKVFGKSFVTWDE